MKGAARVKAELHHSTERRSWGKGEAGAQERKPNLVTSSNDGRARPQHRKEKLWERRSCGKGEAGNQEGKTNLVKGFSKGRGRATLR